jgi:hypothetical protein
MFTNRPIKVLPSPLVHYNVCIYNYVISKITNIFSTWYQYICVCFTILRVYLQNVWDGFLCVVNPLLIYF